jgi:uncharacterized membrane protein
VKVLAVLYDTREEAAEALESVAVLELPLEDIAVVERRGDGRVHVVQTRDVGAVGGGLRGGIAGALVAFAAGLPLAAPAGAALGALIAGAGDRGIDNAFMRAVGANLDAGGACLIVLCADGAARAVSEHLAAPEAHAYEIPAEAQELLRARARARRGRRPSG